MSARPSASFATAAIGTRWQLERVGYFIVDQDTQPGAMVRLVPSATKRKDARGARLVWHVIEITFRIWILQVDRGRNN